MRLCKLDKTLSSPIAVQDWPNHVTAFATGFITSVLDVFEVTCWYYLSGWRGQDRLEGLPTIQRPSDAQA